MLRTTLAAVSLVVAVSVSKPAAAQDDAELKPMVLVAFSGYGELLDDLSYVGKLVDRPALPQMVDGTLGIFTQGKGLAGLDKTKPWGVIVTPDGDQQGFVPVKNLKQLLDALAGITNPSEPDDDGVYELEVGGQPLYVREKDGWAYLGRSAAAVKSPPADPLKLLGELPKQYDLAVQLNVQNVPQPLRDLAISELKKGAEMGLADQLDEDDEQYELRKKLIDNQLDQMEMLVNDTDQVTLGWSIDAKKEKTFLDFAITGTEGSRLAAQAELIKDSKTNFAGFAQPDAAMVLSLASQIPEAEVNQIAAMLGTAREAAKKGIDEEADLPDDESRRELKAAVDDVFDVIHATLKDGRIDGGAVVVLGEEKITVAAGGLVADTAKLEQAVKKFAKVAEKDPDFDGIQWDADQHEGVRFHTMKARVEEDDAQKVLGEELDVVIGVGKKEFYVAFGKDSLKLLKSIIDKSAASGETAVPPLEIIVSLGKVMRFAAAQDDNPITAKVAELLSDPEAQDKIKVTSSYIPRGAQYRIEIEQDVLKAVGKASADAGGGGQGF